MRIDLCTPEPAEEPLDLRIQPPQPLCTSTHEVIDLTSDDEEPPTKRCRTSLIVHGDREEEEDEDMDEEDDDEADLIALAVAANTEAGRRTIARDLHRRDELYAAMGRIRTPNNSSWLSEGSVCIFLQPSCITLGLFRTLICIMIPVCC